MRPARWLRGSGPRAGRVAPRPASGPFARVAVDPAHPLSPSGQERPLCARGGGDMGHEGEGATS